jgi:hypothetical protein
LENPVRRNKSIVIKLFDEYYSILISHGDSIGDLRKTMGMWLDINPVELVIYSKKKKANDLQIIWNLVETGHLDYQIKFEREAFQVDDFKIISTHTRELQFKCDNFQMVLDIQDCLSIRVIKKVILRKAGVAGSWIKFLLNEAVYSDNCKIFEVPKQINMIRMIIFNIENRIVLFKYIDAEFNLIVSNDKMS